MNKFTLGVALLVGGIGAAALAQTPPAKLPMPDEPFWAWGWLAANDARLPAAPNVPTETHTLPGSTLTVMRSEIGAYSPPDWFPGDHPSPVPPIVAKGDMTRMINACSFCHLPNGHGRPENGNISGLPVEYFIQQIADFKNGKRVTSDPRKTNTATMTAFAKNLTDDEVRQAAAYFAAMKQDTNWVKVVEAATVPKTGGNGNWLSVIEGANAGTEPIGNRIVETAVAAEEQEKWRNPRSGFIAYVPPGSIAKGKQLVEAGDGRFAACTVCHGGDLRGLGPVPPLAGRSPSYIARQLYDMQKGNRNGAWTPLMAAVVANLQPADFVNIAAYAASLKP